MLNQVQKEDLSRIAQLCSKLYCIPTDFDPETKALTVSNSFLKRVSVLLQSFFSIAYFIFAFARLVIVVKGGGLQHIIFHIVQIFLQLITAIFFWTSYKHKEELVAFYGYLQCCPDDSASGKC
jgi:hypothetical protein